MKVTQNIRGRGASGNPPSRFESLSYEPDLESQEETDDLPKTQFFRDTSKSLIAYNQSPDVGFDASINPYRGCEHGCIYCYARPTHEYFGLSAGLDFETKVLVKEAAPQLLNAELKKPGWKPQVVAISGVTDPYQPIERKLNITRRCLEVLLQFRNPAAIVTKNRLVTRDRDVLQSMAEKNLVSVILSVTTLRNDLSRRMEPRTSVPGQRLEAIEKLAKAGIPTGILVAPVIPGLTDEELPDIVQSAASSGATFASYIMLRLPYGVSSLFEDWLDRYYPDRKKKILSRINQLRGGRMNDPRFGSRMKGEGVFARHVADFFELACRKSGMKRKGPDLNISEFVNTERTQFDLFSDMKGP